MRENYQVRAEEENVDDSEMDRPQESFDQLKIQLPELQVVWFFDDTRRYIGHAFRVQPQISWTL